MMTLEQWTHRTNVVAVPHGDGMRVTAEPGTVGIDDRFWLFHLTDFGVSRVLGAVYYLTPRAVPLTEADQTIRPWAPRATV